uniref:hypothetical protein n=1 Tax=Limnohabitans sp. TaxID=1907725 RepID=UPI004047B9C1
MPPVSTQPRHAPDADRLHERLAAIIEDLNASNDPAERVGLHLDAEELRAQLAAVERREVSAK